MSGSLSISRRFFIAAAGMAALPATTGCSAQAGLASKDELPDLTLPQENLEGMLRMTASLEQEDVPWWFDGTIFGIVGEQAPKPLVRFEGWEVYWVRPVENNAYELTGHTVTFFYDIESGKMLDTFDNPYTGQRNRVEAAVQGGGAGFGFNYSVNGVRLTKLLDKLPEKAVAAAVEFGSRRHLDAYRNGLPAGIESNRANSARRCLRRSMHS